MLNLSEILKLVDAHCERTGETMTELSRRATRKNDTIRNWRRRVDAGEEASASFQNVQSVLEAIGIRLAHDDDIELQPTRAKRSMISSFDPDIEEANYERAYTREFWKPRVPGAVPEVDMKLGAGEGTVGEIISLPAGNGAISGHRVIAEWLMPEDYLHNEAKVSPNNTIIQEIKGDSMVPNYMPGDRVIIDLSQNEMTTDTVYAISYEGVGEPQIKRLQRVPMSKPPQVMIISDNPSLKDFTVEIADVHIIGRICGVVARR